MFIDTFNELMNEEQAVQRFVLNQSLSESTQTSERTAPRIQETYC